MSISFCKDLERLATIGFLTAFEISLTDSKSPFEDIANPASIISTFKCSNCFAINNFSFKFMEQPGDCSPSLSVVSNIFIILIKPPL